MMKKQLFTVLLLFCTLLSSCSSIYEDLPQVTRDLNSEVLVPIEEGDEYYTQGTLPSSGMLGDGFLFADYWIYTETHHYQELSSISPSGKKLYNGKNMQRLVKVNVGTGEVSSLCLSPTCNHSPRSGCEMMVESLGARMYVATAVEDWLVIEKLFVDEVYGGRYETYAYNPITGEKKEMLVNEYGETTMVDWVGRVPFENKLYSVKVFMDYSNTDYVPGGEKPMYSYEPETIEVCGYYDFDTRKTVELFEIPTGYRMAGVTNKRIFFVTPEGDIVSCAYDGTNMVKEDILDFAATNKIGTYGYEIDTQGFKMYDLKTNTIKRVDLPFTGYRFPTFTKSGIVYDTWTTIDEWDKALDGYETFKEAHPDMRGTELRNAFLEECNKMKYSGTAQIWKSNFEGESLELIFEKKNAIIDTICGSDKYLFGYVYFGDPNNGYKEIAYENEGRSMINLETGEVSSVPTLEFIPPSDELMMEIINKNNKDN